MTRQQLESEKLAAQEAAGSAWREWQRHTDRVRWATEELLKLDPVPEPDPVELAREHGGIEVVLAGSDEDRPSHGPHANGVVHAAGVCDLCDALAQEPGR